MNLGRGHASRLAGTGDDLSLADAGAPRDEELRIVGIGGHIPVGMPDEDQVAVALQLVAGIGNDTMVGSPHGCAVRHRYVDTIVVETALLRPKTRNDLALDRPDESATGSWRLRGDCRLASRYRAGWRGGHIGPWPRRRQPHAARRIGRPYRRCPWTGCPGCLCPASRQAQLLAYFDRVGRA